LAKQIHFDDPAIQFGITVWQNEFNLTILKPKIVAPVFWHKDLAGFQEVWWRARHCLLWHSTQNGISPQKGGKVGQDKEAGLFQVRWPLELSVLPPEITLLNTTKKLSVQQQRLD
jgi:hypothetical protein